MYHIDLHDALDDVPPIGAIEVGDYPKSGDVIPFEGNQYEVIMLFVPQAGDGPDMQAIEAVVARVE